MSVDPDKTGKLASGGDRNAHQDTAALIGLPGPTRAAGHSAVEGSNHNLVDLVPKTSVLLYEHPEARKVSVIGGCQRCRRQRDGKSTHFGGSDPACPEDDCPDEITKVAVGVVFDLDVDLAAGEVEGKAPSE